jgi:glycosyltransferase involved in cell wall biosynthesis
LSHPAPLVSVLLPCYNAAEFLPACITSLENQSLQELEVIAVDDGSGDQTIDLLQQWSARDTRVNLFTPGRIGLTPALQLASCVARGRFLARMDADDSAHPERLLRQLNWLTNQQNIAACGTQVQYFPAEHVRAGARAYQDWLNSLTTPDELARNIFVECPIAHPALMVRTDIFHAVGGYQERDWPEDYDLILRIWSAGYELSNVPEILLDWRERPDRMSRTNTRYSLDAFRRCKVHYLLKTLVKQRPIVIWGAGPVGKAWSRELSAQGATLRAFVDIDPRKIGQTVHNLTVCGPNQLKGFKGCFFVAAVGSAQARSEIRAALHAAAFAELKDFCAVA